MPDTGQEDWADEVQEAFDIIDSALRNINETSVDKSTATFDGINIDSSLSLDDDVSLALGTDEDLTATYNSSENTTYIEDTSSGDTLFALPHGSGNISVGRALVDSASGSSYATESYADSTAQTTATNTVSGDISPSSVDTGGLNVDGQAVQTALDGYVTAVGAGVGVADAIDPSSTSTPVQDAVNLLPSPQGGDVIIPPQGVINSGQITLTPNVSIRGFGPGDKAEPISEIYVDVTNTDCIVCDPGSSNKAQYNTIDGINLRGPGHETNSGKGIHITDGSNQLHIGHVQVYELGNHALYISGSNEARIDHFLCNAIEPPTTNTREAIYIGPSAGLAVNLISGYVIPWNSDTPTNRFITFESGSINVQNLNIGGSVEVAVAVGHNACATFGMIRDEPVALSNLSTPQNASAAIVNFGKGVCHIQGTMIVATDGVEFERVYWLQEGPNGENGEGNVLGPIRGAAAVNQGRVTLGTDLANPYNPNIYYGPSSGVSNNTGSTLSSPLICLGDLTKFT